MPGLDPWFSGTFCALRSARHYSCSDVGDVPDTKGDNAVRHQNTVFHTVLKHLPWGEFERLIEVRGADQRQRGFTAKTAGGDDLCPAFRRAQPARDRGRAEQPSDAALSFGDRLGPPF